MTGAFWTGPRGRPNGVRVVAMTKMYAELGLKEELMILMFWAHSIDIRRKLTPEQIRAVAGLEEIIEAASHLPDAIGWGDESRSGRGRNGKARAGAGTRP